MLFCKYKRKIWKARLQIVILKNKISVTTPMKRCNNCGWFNLDSAEYCEKCEDDSFEYVASEVDTNVVKDDTCVEANPVDVSESVKASSMMATVAFGSAVPVKQPSHKAMSATVMDTSSLILEDEEVHCPKCRYPIVGLVDYCPNCGATVKSSSVASVSPVATVTRSEACNDMSSSMLKATVRDVPEELITDERGVYRLVPMDSLGEAPYEMHIGDVVVIGGRRFKFQK